MKTIVGILAMIAYVAAQNEGLYTTLTCMAQHQIGRDEEYKCEAEEMFNYLQQVFKVDDETHEQALREARNMRTFDKTLWIDDTTFPTVMDNIHLPVTHLDVNVIEAKDLFSKDSDGKNDVLCRIFMESSPTSQYETTIKNNTLTPIWNERFDLELKHAETDVLHIKVWDVDYHEPFSKKISECGNVSGIRGFYRLAKEITRSVVHDNENITTQFIGGSRIALKDIPLTGSTAWYRLEKPGKSSDRGFIRLGLAFSAEKNTQTAVLEHRRLLSTFLSHELVTTETVEYCWQGIWSPAAGTLLNQYRARNGLLPRNVALSEWVVYSSIHEKHPLHFGVFDTLSNELLQPMNDQLFSSDDVTLFWEAAQKVLHSCFHSIREINFLPKCSKNPTEELTHILRIISSISSLQVPENFDLFPNEMYSWLTEQHDGEINVLKMLEYVVRQNGIVWWSNLLQNDDPGTATDQDDIEYRLGIVQLVMDKLRQTRDSYDRTFIETVDFSYARTLYILYQERLSDPYITDIERVCSELGRITDEINFPLMSKSPELNLSKTLFKFYQAFRSFFMYGRDLGVDDLGSMAIHNYYEWFRCGVLRWLEEYKYDTDRQIERSIEIDQLDTPVDSYKLLESKSADAVWLVYKQMTNFWTEMAWPNVEESLAYIEIIVKHARRAAMAYADMMLKKLEIITQMSGETEDTSVSKAWCFVVSNIDYVKKIIRPWADDVPKLVDKLYNNETQREGHYFRAVITELVDECIDSLESRTVKLLENVGNKMAVAAGKYITGDAELSDEISMRNNIRRFEENLEDSRRMLSDNLNQDTFHRLDVIIWEKLLKTLFQVVNRNLNEKRPFSFYANLNDFFRYLTQRHSVVYVNEPTANVDMLTKLENIFEVYGKSTEDLIDLYTIARIEEQKNLNEPIDGKLAVKAAFFHASLIVEILNGRNLRPIKLGQDDRFVKLKLLPKDKFLKNQKRKTDVQKDTFYPLFDETFDIPLSAEQRSLKNACVIFEMMNYTFMKNEFMAEAFLPFSEIPEIDDENELKSLKQILLNLSRPGNTRADIVNALRYRKDDKKARKFIAMFERKTV